MSGWQLLPMAVRGSSSRPFFQHPQGPHSSPPSPVPTLHSATTRPPPPRSDCSPFLPHLSLSGKPHLLQVGLALPAVGTKIRVGTACPQEACSLRGGGWVQQAVEQGRACGAVGPHCGRWRRAAPAVSPLLSWGLQPHSVLKASLRAFSSFPIAQTEL